MKKLLLFGLIFVAGIARTDAQIPSGPVMGADGQPLGIPNSPIASIDLPVVGVVNLSNFLQNAGGIVAYDNHKAKWAGASARVLWTPKNPALAIVGLEIGVLWEPTTGAPSGVMSAVGVRADNLAARIGMNSWINQNIGHLAVPAVELGPFGGYLSVRKEWIYGAFIAKKFGA